MNKNSRTILAACLSLAVLFTWQLFFLDSTAKYGSEVQVQNESPLEITEQDIISINREKALALAKQEEIRLPFKNGLVQGSINLRGARIDDLRLLTHKETYQGKDVTLLSPANTQKVHYAEFGWISYDKGIDLPNSKTIWTADVKELGQNELVNLSWVNKEGTQFLISVSLDQEYMFGIEQRVTGNNVRNLKAYSALSRSNVNPGKKEMLIHEGAIGVFNGKLSEITYSNLDKKQKYNFRDNNGGWFGFVDKYWLTAIIPSEKHSNIKFSSHVDNVSQRYQADIVSDHNPGESENSNQKFFLYAGAKNLKVLDNYEKKYQIHLFDRAVDFGMLYFITKPMFITLNFIYRMVGNFGVAILVLTILIKMLLFPLAYKGFKGMNKLKELQPEMKRIKEAYPNDNAQLQKAMLTLYRREKINPMSSCLPIFLQMPIFFALYKVLYVTIEMRHAPFFGWIKDLSSPDPSNVFSLFGLIPWNPPAFMMIGILPIIMAGTLFLQQALNPQSGDPTQARIMKLFPLVFLFMFSSFPSGLVLYWSWSNILSILQQIIIKQIYR